MANPLSLRRIARLLAGIAPAGVIAFAVSGAPLQGRLTGAEKGAPNFARDVFPILKGKCSACHGADSHSGGLRLDTAEGIKKGGVSGPLFIPKKGADSLIVHRLLGLDGKPRMPMGFAPLSDQDIARIRAWIDTGADFGETAAKKHWAYVPPKMPAQPLVKNSKWCRNPIDAFILARLEREGLQPSKEAPKEILCRRLHLDLTGLPPSVEELDLFLADNSPKAYEKLVDRLLASPHYGEKMAGPWLDLARYADTNGYEKDLPRSMWLWRDWVINAFNKNMPYDQFTVEQLAGDLLPNPTHDQLIATGFQRNSMLNDEGGIDPEEFRVVAVMDRIDAVATTWLGSTLACAQCHNHKYDPFPQRDYYGMYAFYNQSADNGRDIDPILKVPNPDQKRELDRLEAELARAKTELLARTPTALSHQAEWEAQLKNGWKALVPAQWNSMATLRKLPDNSLLASGQDPVEDLYIVRYNLQESSIAGIRIEAIPDPSLPEGSSGRNFNGNFVLRKIEAKILVPEGSDIPLQFESAKADYTQGGHDAMAVIQDGDKPGWAIAGFLPEQRVHHEIVLKLKSPVSVRQGQSLIVRYIHQSVHKNHNLGRFRLSVTTDAELASLQPPTSNIQVILNKSIDLRSEQEHKQLEESYLRIAPDLLETNRNIADLQKRLDELEASIPTTMVLRESEKRRMNAVLTRGDFRTPGGFVQPHTPVALGSWATRPDRLGLARWLVSDKNPLTSRVEVNRLWEQCFGHGIVATMEDFGSQGEPPTHPELLDWLAIEFMAKKWDMKAMLKLIVTSATYRQSAAVDQDLVKRDPNNLLYGRGSRFRLGAEGVRDIALSASGRLTPTIGGPSVFPPQPPGVWENSFTFYDTKDRWVNEEGSNRYRRGLYTYWRRTAPYPMALTFDLKQRDTCVAKRVRTNTPLQALNTLNDPTFIECAGELALKLHDLYRSDPGTPDQARLDKAIRYGFRACTSREPTPKDLKVLKKLVFETLTCFRADASSVDKLIASARISSKHEYKFVLASFIVVANALLNLDETVTKG